MFVAMLDARRACAPYEHGDYVPLSIKPMARSSSRSDAWTETISRSPACRDWSPRSSRRGDRRSDRSNDTGWTVAAAAGLCHASVRRVHRRDRDAALHGQTIPLATLFERFPVALLVNSRA
jgi:hypothetical protein